MIFFWQPLPLRPKFLLISFQKKKTKTLLKLENSKNTRTANSSILNWRPRKPKYQYITVCFLVFGGLTIQSTATKELSRILN